MGPHLWTFKKDKVAIEGVFMPVEEVWNIPRTCRHRGAEVLRFLSFENSYVENIGELKLTEEWFYISRGTDLTFCQPINRNTKLFGTGFPEAITSYTSFCPFGKIDHYLLSERVFTPLFAGYTNCPYNCLCAYAVWFTRVTALITKKPFPFERCLIYWRNEILDILCKRHRVS